jgi:hypothetical protein
VPPSQGQTPRPAGGAYGAPRRPEPTPDYEPPTTYDPANDYYSPPTGYDESTGYTEAGGYEEAGAYEQAAGYEEGYQQDYDETADQEQSEPSSGKRRLDVTATDLGYTGRRTRPDHAAADDDYGPEENTGYTGYGAPSPARW